MIVPRSPQVLRMAQYVGKPLLLLAVYDLLVVVAYQVMHWAWVALPHIPLALYGSAIGVILGFRNQSSYARWWLTPLLREAELSALREEKNVPLALQWQMATLLEECKDRGWIDGWQWRAMDESLNDLADAQGGAERIKNTPMPKQYDYFPQLFVHIYCMLLPLALVTNMGWFTPLGSTLVGFIFLALDKIGRDLEDPFENTIYDVPLTSITRTIEVNLRQLLDETNLPQPEAAVRGVLW